MKVRLTILCENSVGIPFGVVGEHGFACFVETDDGNYLFDTGQGLGISSNARVLQKDLKTIKAIMLSHGHYDHTGGLPAVLQDRGPVDVHAHPDLFVQRYWSKDDRRRFIGIPYRRSYLEAMGARFRLGGQLTQIGSGVYLTGEIPRRSSFEKGDTNMSAILTDGRTLHPDPLNDDLSMVIESDHGLIIVLGCAHAGMINILEYVRDHFDAETVYAVIGGTHLGFSSETQFEETLRVLDRYRIERVGVSHCTGLKQAAALHHHLKDRFFFGSVGAVLEG